MTRKRNHPANVQLKLFTKTGSGYTPTGASRGTSEPKRGRSWFLSELSRNRALSVELLIEAVSGANVSRAYKRVYQNGGSAGIDGMSVKELSEWFTNHWPETKRALLSGKYLPNSVLSVSIPKGDGGHRELGIPTVVDRLIQQAIHQVVSPLYEPLFSESSYGYRPGRSAHGAVRKASEYVETGHTWVVDLDLKSFFDTINHDRLMQRLSKGIGDKRLLRLIHSYLRAGMLRGGVTSPRVSGTPQGGPLSPLLSNIVLDELDKELEKREHLFVRYADDCMIFVQSERAAHRVLASISQFIETKLKLKINHEKSGVRHCSNTSFLGYTILPEGKLRISDKSKARFKKRVRSITKRNRGYRFERIIAELNTYIQGWVTYFRLAETWLDWKGLDGWIRRRLRCYRLKQRQRIYSVVKFLIQLGAPESKAWNAVIYGGGWWNLSNKVVCKQTMDIQWFREQGFLSTEAAYAHTRVKR